jgi:hypothetical protein
MDPLLMKIKKNYLRAGGEPFVESSVIRWGIFQEIAEAGIKIPQIKPGIYQKQTQTRKENNHVGQRVGYTER